MADTKTLTLTDFLLARIAEDEAGVDGMFHAEELGYPLTDQERRLTARVLADCEAKRRIVELHAPHYAARGLLFCFTCRAKDNSGGWHPAPCATLLALAAVYADHRDYRDEWRP